MHTVEAEDTTKDALVSNFSMLSSEKKNLSFIEAGTKALNSLIENFG